MTVKLRLIRAIALVLGLGFAIVLQAAPACVSQNDVGTSEVPVIQAPGAPAVRAQRLAAWAVPGSTPTTVESVVPAHR
ncbi:hypothetical protein [Pseudomonas sp. S2_G10]